MSDFEIIELTEVEYVRRGRKSNVDPKVVDALTKLPKGKAIALTTMKQDPKSPTYATDKARTTFQEFSVAFDRANRLERQPVAEGKG